MIIPKILVGISMHPGALNHLKQSTDLYIFPWNYPKEQLLPVIGNYDGMIVYTPDSYSTFLENALRLRVIACHACSPEMLNLYASHRISISVTPYLFETVADLTLALMFAAARNIPQVHAEIRSGQWEKSDLKVKYSGLDVFGKTLGILGLGRIGTILARRVQGFDMKLLYHDLIRKEALEKELHIEYRLLPQLLAESDILVVLVPLDRDTQFRRACRSL